MATRRLLFAFVACSVYVSSVVCRLALSDFYPFGKRTEDAQLLVGSHKLVNLSTVLVVNGEVHNNLYVS